MRTNRFPEYGHGSALKISVVARNNDILKKLVLEAKREYEKDAEHRVHIFLADTDSPELWQRYLDLGQQQDKDLRPESLNRVRTQEERWEQEQERFQHKHDRERQNRERRDRKRRDREQKREEKERRKRARRLRQIQMLQLLKAPLQVLLLALLSSILFVLLAVLALALVGWFTFIGLLVTVVAYLLLIISRATICADFAFLSFKGSLSVPARAPKLLASEAGRIKALGCRLLRAQGLRRNGRTPLWRADAAENRLR